MDELLVWQQYFRDHGDLHEILMRGMLAIAQSMSGKRIRAARLFPHIAAHRDLNLAGRIQAALTTAGNVSVVKKNIQGGAAG